MPRIYTVRQSFNSGEISELCAFRDDVAKYNSGCLTLENAVPLVEGGAKKMPGTYFAGETASNAKSRLAPFQFSTTQGAILEFSEKKVRIWEGATEGDWSLGLALDLPSAALDYNPATLYAAADLALLGPWGFASQDAAGTLFIAAPYGSGNASMVPVNIVVNSVDALSVDITGSSPNQGLQINLANATAALNSAAAIQAAIRAVTSLNSPTTNYVDLTGWTVTPDPTYYASPWITLSVFSITVYLSVYSLSNLIIQCVAPNQYDQFPFINDYTSGQVIWNSSYWIQDTSFTGTPIVLVTPYLEEDLFELDCSTQSADVIWVFHQNYPPAVIERLGPNSWAYSLSLPGQQPNEPPYRGTLGQVKTGYSALGQSITGITQANPCVVSVAATTAVFDVGSRVYLNEIAGMVELNQGEFLVAFPTLGSGTFSFSLLDPDTGVFVDSTGYLKYVSGGFAVQVVPLFAAGGDYPACGTLYQERLCVGGSINHPTQMNGSVQGDYPNFICDPNAEDFAIQFTLVSNKLDQILNMIGTPNSLVIGTAGGVWIMAGANGQSLSQINVTAAKQTSMGVSALQPQLINSSAIFVSRSARIVLFMVFNFVSNQWDSYDLTRLNRVITLGPTEETSGIAQTGFQIEPYPIFWAVRNDGQLIGLVFNTQDQVYAWFRINMSPGKVESVAVISGKNQEDQVVIVVNRTIDGNTKRYVEYFMPQEIFSDLSNAYFVYCGQQLKLKPSVAITDISQSNPTVVTAPNHGFANGMSVQITDALQQLGVFPNATIGPSPANQDASQAYTISAVTADTFELDGMDSTLPGWGTYAGFGKVKQVTNEVTGMSWLLGQQVVAVGDGALILQPTLVDSDTVTFPYYVNFVTIGLPYQITVQPTNPVLASQGSTTRGMKQKLSEVTLSLYQSMGGMFGTDLAHMYPITYGQGAMGQQPQMSTFEVSRDFDADWDDQSTLFITQSDPLPFTLRGLVAEMSVNQG